VRILIVSVGETSGTEFRRFVRLHHFFEASFPQVHRQLTRATIGGYGLGTTERIAVESFRDCVRFYAQLFTNEVEPSG
jgi:hypothetical protein